jgi:hypothetical protein
MASHTTGLFIIIIITLVVAMAMVPSTCAQGILVCANRQQNGNLTYLSPQRTWGRFGQAGTCCMGNSVTGLYLVTSFTYYLYINLHIPSPMQVSAYASCL